MLEFIVVLAGLSILSSLAIPNISRIIGLNNIDEAKSLLNAAAADCLQSARLNPESSVQQINSSIISNKRLSNIGYQINSSAKDCSYLELLPTNPDATLRYPIGFSIARGKVTKFATPTSSDQGSIASCEGWAGENCKQDQAIEELIAYNKQISEAKRSCEVSYSDWMEANGNGPINRWNPAADSKCPSRPPKVVNSTCTTNGCNRKVYALDGTVVGYTQEDYDRALESKYGRICTEKIEAIRRQSPPFTNSKNTPVKISECGTKEFWFHKGKEVASEEEWKSKMCTDKIESNINTVGAKKLDFCGDRTYYFCGGKDQLSKDNYDACLASNAEAKCIADREKARTSGHKGKYGPFAGPQTCGETRWMCNGIMMETEEVYKQSSCGKTKTCGIEDPDLCARTGLACQIVCK